MFQGDWAIHLSYDFPYHLACRGITVPILISRKINMLLFFFFCFHFHLIVTAISYLWL